MISERRVLALDLARATGWAYLDERGVDSGMWKNPHSFSDSPGAYFHEFARWLVEVQAQRQPQVIVWEMNHPHSGKHAESYYGCLALVRRWAYRNGAEQAFVYPNTLKKWATESGKAGKDSMMAAMRSRWGRTTTDDNEADALAVLAWAMENVRVEG